MQSFLSCNPPKVARYKSYYYKIGACTVGEEKGWTCAVALWFILVSAIELDIVSEMKSSTPATFQSFNAIHCMVSENDTLEQQICENRRV